MQLSKSRDIPPFKSQSLLIYSLKWRWKSCLLRVDIFFSGTGDNSTLQPPAHSLCQQSGFGGQRISPLHKMFEVNIWWDRGNKSGSSPRIGLHGREEKLLVSYFAMLVCGRKRRLSFHWMNFSVGINCAVARPEWICREHISAPAGWNSGTYSLNWTRRRMHANAFPLVTPVLTNTYLSAL